MVTSDLWHKTVLELAKSGMKYLDAVKMADGIIESYLRRYPEKEKSPDKKIKCVGCDGTNVVEPEEKIGPYNKLCTDCNMLFKAKND